MLKPHSIVIIPDARAIVLILLAVLVIGWAEGYRRRGDLMRVEAQNARILELLEGSETTRVSVSGLRLNQLPSWRLARTLGRRRRH